MKIKYQLIDINVFAIIYLHKKKQDHQCVTYVSNALVCTSQKKTASPPAHMNLLARTACEYIRMSQTYFATDGRWYIHAPAFARTRAHVCVLHDAASAKSSASRSLIAAQRSVCITACNNTSWPLRTADQCAACVRVRVWVCLVCECNRNKSTTRPSAHKRRMDIVIKIIIV